MKAKTTKSSITLSLSVYLLVNPVGQIEAQTNTFPSAGNVGIGTTSPGTNLEVLGNAPANGGVFLTDTNYPSVTSNGTIYIRNNGMYSYTLPISSGTTDGGYRVGLDIENFTTDSTFNGTLAAQYGLWARVGDYVGSGSGTIQNVFGIYIDNLSEGSATITNNFGLYQAASNAKNFFNGDVGIGTQNPLALLDIAGAMRLENPSIATSYFATITSYYDSSHPFGLNVENNTGGIAIEVEGVYSPAGGGSVNLVMGLNGNVGIGTTDPAYPLSVNGTIQAKEIIVNTGWSDFVFGTGYRLAPLAEVEAYIKSEHHLPGIPAEKQIAEKGVSLGDMQSRLLAQIEQLTLHQIEQEKCLKEQSAQLSKQADEIKALKQANLTRETPSYCR